MSQRYFGKFGNYQDMDQWSGALEDAMDDEIVLAEYDLEDYTGSATCVFKRNGKLFEVHDSHCSCNELDRWEPEETSKEALLMYTYWTPEQRALIESI